MSLHKKIFFAFFLVALIPFYILLYYTYNQNQDLLLKKYNVLQERKLQVTATLVREDLKELERELGFLSSLALMDDLISGDVDKRIQGVVDLKYRVFKLDAQINVKDTQMECVASTNSCLKDTNALTYTKEVCASFDSHKMIGVIELILPYSSLSYYFENKEGSWCLTDENDNALNECSNKEKYEIITQDLGYKLKLSLLLKKETLNQSLVILQNQLLSIALFSLLLFLTLFVLVSRAIVKPVAQNEKLQEQKLRLQSSQLILLEKAKHLAQTKARFISQMSHEFRTPLNSIIGFSQFLDQENLVDEEYKKLPKNIEKAGKHLLEMVNQILDYAKAQSEHLALDIQTIDLKTLINETMEIMKPLSDKKSLDLSCECDNTVVSCDKKMLTNIILNLLANAIKFTSKGYVKVSVSNYMGNTKICVEDSGVGMSEEESKILFEPFSRLKSADKIEGTGLGLALCMSYSQLINADLFYESKNIGSKFILILKGNK